MRRGRGSSAGCWGLLAAAVTVLMLGLAFLGAALLPMLPASAVLGLCGALALVLGWLLRRTASARGGWGRTLLWAGWVLALMQWGLAQAERPAGLPYWLAGLALAVLGAALSHPEAASMVEASTEGGSTAEVRDSEVRDKAAAEPAEALPSSPPLAAAASPAPPPAPSVWEVRPERGVPAWAEEEAPLPAWVVSDSPEPAAPPTEEGETEEGETAEWEAVPAAEQRAEAASAAAGHIWWDEADWAEAEAILEKLGPYPRPESGKPPEKDGPAEAWRRRGAAGAAPHLDTEDRD